MKNNDLIQESYSALASNRVRSGLTVLGIVIGIASVIAMVAIGQGAQSSIQSSIQSIGSNLVIVMPSFQRSAATGGRAGVSAGRGSAQTLTLADSQAMQNEITQAKAVAPDVESRFQVTAKGTNTNTEVMGTTPDYPTVRNVAIAQGAFFTAQQVADSSKVAIIGPTTRDDLFGTDSSNVIGQTIKIKQLEFKVIGITQSKGGTGFTNQDDIIYVPLSTAQHFLTGTEYVNSISVAAESANDMAAVQQQITNLLLQRHGIGDPAQADFQVLNQADLVATASGVTNTFTILLASIAGISLIVGGIGIMNMMLTTVTERTKEIGLRKAIGATKADINSQFLLEAVMLTFLGGLVGILIGWLASLAITNFAGIKTNVSLFSVILAFGVSTAIGLIFGYYPARRASRLNPIEALRFE